MRGGSGRRKGGGQRKKKGEGRGGVGRRGNLKEAEVSIEETVCQVALRVSQCLGLDLKPIACPQTALDGAEAGDGLHGAGSE